MIDAQQRAAAKAFAKNWKDRGYEKGRWLIRPILNMKNLN